MKTFDEIRLPDPLMKALQALALKTPTPIQFQTIPSALTKRDVLGLAPVGSGKTTTAGILVMARLLKSPGKTGVIMVPTAERAKKVEALWKNLSKFAPEASSALLIESKSAESQVRAIDDGARLFITTPGQMVEHIKRGNLSLSQTEVFAVDGADEILELGFAPQLGQILRFLPRVRQTLIFSEVYNQALDLLASKYLKDPVRATVEQTAPAPEAKKTSTRVKNPLKRASAPARSRSAGSAREQASLRSQA